MTIRASTLLSGRRERLERILERELQPPTPAEANTPLEPHVREFLREEAEDLYWNELEWENITYEEALEGGRSPNSPSRASWRSFAGSCCAR
jgi:hypothetical protein